MPRRWRRAGRGDLSGRYLPTRPAGARRCRRGPRSADFLLPADMHTCIHLHRRRPPCLAPTRGQAWRASCPSATRRFASPAMHRGGAAPEQSGLAWTHFAAGAYFPSSLSQVARNLDRGACCGCRWPRRRTASLDIGDLAEVAASADQPGHEWGPRSTRELGQVAEHGRGVETSSQPSAGRCCMSDIPP